MPDDGVSFFSAAAGAHPVDVITSVYLITANGARAHFAATSDAANDVCNGIRWRGRRGEEGRDLITAALKMLNVKFHQGDGGRRGG